MKTVKAKISITLDTDLLEELRVLASEDERSLSQYINMVLRRDTMKLKEEQDQ